MRQLIVVFLFAVAACGGSGAEGPSPSAPPAAGPTAPAADAGPPPAPAPAGPTLAGCPMFPAGNEWNRDVSSDPVDPRSGAYLAFMGASWRNLHADFGSDPSYGIPFVV